MPLSSRNRTCAYYALGPDCPLRRRTSFRAVAQAVLPAGIVLASGESLQCVADRLDELDKDSHPRRRWLSSCTSGLDGVLSTSARPGAKSTNQFGEGSPIYDDECVTA